MCNWPILGCGAGQGMVFVLSVLNSVYNSAQVYPKPVYKSFVLNGVYQGLCLKKAIYVFYQLLVLNRVRVSKPQGLTYTQILVECPRGLVPRERKFLHFLGVEGNFPTSTCVYWPESGACQNSFQFCISSLNLPIKRGFALIALIWGRKHDWKILVTIVGSRLWYVKNDVMVQLFYYIHLT